MARIMSRFPRMVTRYIDPKRLRMSECSARSSVIPVENIE
jgi:hypothetical protein